jgi:N-acetylneuraminate synthase
MIIEKNISKYITYAEDSIKNALKKIENNHSKIIFAVTDDNKLIGVLTDGDFRRWLLDDEIRDHDLEQPVDIILNRNFKYLFFGESPKRIRESLSSEINIIPLINEKGKLEAIARRRTNALQIGNATIGEEGACFIIAEIGNNHNGDFELAKKLVDEAKNAGADCAKFQMRDMSSLYRNKGQADDAEEDLGSQYTLDLLSKFQLPNEDLLRLFDYCYAKEIIPLCTPWDLESLNVLENYGMLAYKIASADFTNHELLKHASLTGKPLICSTGMCSEAEIKDSINVLQDMGAQYILLHCNSTYPAPFKDINLNYMNRLKTLGDSLVGYSGHERGIQIPMAAVALGAKVIEKHLTIDKGMEGNDHKVSLLPDEFQSMVIGIRSIEESMGNADFRQITQGELMNRETLGKSLIINKDVKAGVLISAEMIEIRSPGKGLSPYYKEKLIGRVAQRDFKKGDFFYPSDIETDSTPLKKEFKFQHAWGLPVRYHDFKEMVGLTNLDLVEFHLSYKDLNVNISDFIKARYENLDFVVHSPELFENDHLLDLCTDDLAYRKKSILEMQKVINVTRKLKDFFPSANLNPLIVVNVGGFTLHNSMSKDKRKSLYQNLMDSLSQLDRAGVELIPQTMPPFPWLFGGQRYHNLFLDPDEIVEFCKNANLRICLDISHSKLACNHFHWSFSEFIEKVSSVVAHMHIVDAKGVDGEGLQIGEGEIDFFILARLLNEKAAKASFIPEIWQGHKNNGEGFFIALTRLEKFNF